MRADRVKKNGEQKSGCDSADFGDSRREAGALTTDRRGKYLASQEICLRIRAGIVPGNVEKEGAALLALSL